jgi:hypothetical protein
MRADGALERAGAAAIDVTLVAVPVAVRAVRLADADVVADLARGAAVPARWPRAIRVEEIDELVAVVVVAVLAEGLGGGAAALAIGVGAVDEAVAILVEPVIAELRPAAAIVDDAVTVVVEPIAADLLRRSARTVAELRPAAAIVDDAVTVVVEPIAADLLSRGARADGVIAGSGTRAEKYQSPKCRRGTHRNPPAQEWIASSAVLRVD